MQLMHRLAQLAPGCWRSAEAEAMLQQACMLMISTIVIPRIPHVRATSGAIAAMKLRLLAAASG
jgi:hypothetical protein